MPDLRNKFQERRENAEWELKVLNYIEKNLYDKKLLTYSLEVFVSFFLSLEKEKKKEERKKKTEEEEGHLLSNTQPLLDSDDD